MSFLTRDRGGSDTEGDDRAVNDLLRVLRSIDSRLALLSASHQRDLRRRLAAEVLRAGGREAMWDAIDGKRTSNDLASAADVSNRFAQLFVNELLGLGLVRRVERDGGRGTVVEKDDIGLVEWYLGLGQDDSAGSSPLGRN